MPDSKKSVRLNMLNSSHKVREFMKKILLEKIKFTMKSKIDRIPNWTQMSSLNTRPTDISSNHFMKPTIYKWLKDILI